jgi:hypothetical protein
MRSELCQNIVETIAEFDPIFIPDISKYIVFVILDYELMNPVWWWIIIFLIFEKVGIDFSFLAHFNQLCDLSCANIVEIIAESDSILISDISR